MDLNKSTDNFSECVIAESFINELNEIIDNAKVTTVNSNNEHHFEFDISLLPQFIGTAATATPTPPSSHTDTNNISYSPINDNNDNFTKSNPTVNEPTFMSPENNPDTSKKKKIPFNIEYNTENASQINNFKDSNIIEFTCNDNNVELQITNTTSNVHPIQPIIKQSNARKRQARLNGRSGFCCLNTSLFQMLRTAEFPKYVTNRNYYLKTLKQILTLLQSEKSTKLHYYKILNNINHSSLNQMLCTYKTQYILVIGWKYHHLFIEMELMDMFPCITLCKLIRHFFLPTVADLINYDMEKRTSSYNMFNLPDRSQ